MPIVLCILFGIIGFAITVIAIIALIDDFSGSFLGLLLVIFMDIVIFGSIYGGNIQIRTYQVIMSENVTERIADCDYQYYKIKFYDRKNNIVYNIEFDGNEYNAPKVGEKVELTYREFRTKYKVISKEYIKS